MALPAPGQHFNRTADMRHRTRRRITMTRGLENQARRRTGHFGRPRARERCPGTGASMAFGSLGEQFARRPSPFEFVASRG